MYVVQYILTIVRKGLIKVNLLVDKRNCKLLLVWVEMDMLLVWNRWMIGYCTSIFSLERATDTIFDWLDTCVRFRAKWPPSTNERPQVLDRSLESRSPKQIPRVPKTDLTNCKNPRIWKIYEQNYRLIGTLRGAESWRKNSSS